jgi:GT2 family glycosyltransferase
LVAVNGWVTALLVSHDGGRWLPEVLDSLSRQTVPPSAVVAVDTGSRDGSVAMLRSGLPDGTVLETDRDTRYPAAVRAGLGALGPAGDHDWVWLLHDDSAPAPDALERLLAARATHSAAGGPDVLGPKIREWPSLRRILEVGVTITGTAQRETGLERGEYDQGQHDEPRDVLAVNTAGMLVRRTVLERLGLDDELPVIHTDLDFGWRAARAGLRVRTVPDAVVFHAEASRTGTREPDLDRAARRRRERGAALYTVLVNCATAAMPFIALRLLAGAVLRALGLLLVRAPGEAWAELRAAAATLLRPGRLVRARRARHASSEVGSRAVRHLLAPAWLPYRHGLDELGEIGAAVVGEAGARTGTTDGRPSAWRRLGRSPSLWLLVTLTLISLVAARDLLGVGRLAGGALLPAPDSAVDWWRTYLSTTHDVATGSSTTAPAYLLPLAIVATVLLGSASAAVDLLVLGAVPLAALGGYRFLQRFTGSTIASAWGAASYAVLLATSGAVTQGRAGTLAAGVVLPWLAASALGLASDSADRRRRAGWRTALWLALATAFAPLTWVLAAVVTAGAVVAALVGRLDLRRLGPALLPLPVSAALILPWAALVWPDRGWSALFLEAGLPASALVGPLDALDVIGARATETAAAPVWVAGFIGVAALLALLRGSTRRSVALCWAVGLVGLAGVWATAGIEVDDQLRSGTVLVWAGVPLLLLHGAWVSAAAVGSAGLRAWLGGRAFGWRQPAGLLVVALALVLPVCGTVWWVGHGSEGPLGRVDTAPVPAYMDAAADRDAADGTLVLRGSLEDGLTTEVRRGAPMTLGEEAVLPPASEQEPLTRAVSDLVTAPGPTTTGEIAGQGAAYVFVPEPVDAGLASALDAVPALASASADDPVARAWRLDDPTSMPPVETGMPAWLRPLLLGVQAMVLLVVVVLAAPTRSRPS